MGRQFQESETGALKQMRMPISAFRKEITDWMRETTDPTRVAKYAAETTPFPPIYLKYNQRGQLIVSDGGHRLLAAIDRGDKYIEVLVPVH